MNILLLGSGGREHALAWKIKQSKHCNNLWVAPGNAGTAEVAENLSMNILDFDAVATACLEKNIDLLVVGPEEPLVKGISDYFRSNPNVQHIKVVGPSQKGAQLEGSKSFAKAFMQKNKIPTAAYKRIDASNIDEGMAFLESLPAPYVLKADGLAGGKGVLILSNLSEAQTELKSILSGKFGAAGNQVVIEQFIHGIEMSVFVLTDGKEYQLLPSAKDYKRIGQGDTGLNTGGMGAVSPVPFADNALMEKIEKRVVQPTIQGLQNDKIDYKGFVFIGLMISQNEPYVIEYNCRLGDPETEVLMLRIESDLVEHINSLFDGTLDKSKVRISSQHAVTVMTVSEGYPEAYEKGFEIAGLSNVSTDSVVFHAGTTCSNNKVFTNGGRVLAVTSQADTLQSALHKSYDNLNKLCYENIYYRKDIGYEFI